MPGGKIQAFLYMRKLYHLFIKETFQHHYYGDLKVLTANHTPEELDISIHTLYRYDFDQPFENEKIIIRKGMLMVSKHKV